MHLSENCYPLKVNIIPIGDQESLVNHTKGFNDVCLLRLPALSSVSEFAEPLQHIDILISELAQNLGPQATLIILGEVIDLVHIQPAIISNTRYQLWIAIKRKTFLIHKDSWALPVYHYGALVHTRYNLSLRHAKTRIAYTYCPHCDKTTKDYGGKKHTYHNYGTSVSDVWRDIECDFNQDISPVIERFADLFGIKQYKELRVLDCNPMGLKRRPIRYTQTKRLTKRDNLSTHGFANTLLNGDSLQLLHGIPDNSVDFAFADPPYNLGKNYTGHSDDMGITDYFRWCDEWIAELRRILRPGRTCAILNIPLWAIRHFTFMQTILWFQSWIVWDALSFPVRLIMPAHYSILCFSKGTPRRLPGLTDSVSPAHFGLLDANSFLDPMAESYCLRSSCLEERRKLRLNDRAPLTDVWWDIHRLKHNTRRVDHPCQLPPRLMYRLISLFTKSGEVVLDCFNGAGTTTLAAHQLGRKYIGIEKSTYYHGIALSRHKEIERGLDPFRKAERILEAKNSPVPRMPKQKYHISKKTLQLEVRRVAAILGHIPTREELVGYSNYPISYYDQYFASWGEVCAAARTTGMSETRQEKLFVATENLLLFDNH